MSISIKKASMEQLEKELRKRRLEKLAKLEADKNEIEKKIQQLSNSEDITTKINSKHNKLKIKKMVANHKGSSDKPSLKTRIMNYVADGKSYTIKELLDMCQKDGWTTSYHKPYQVVATMAATLQKANKLQKVNKGTYKIYSPTVTTTATTATIADMSLSSDTNK